ncbi:Phage protein [Helicobacter acinonychis]|nr:Phage protein [Helicobacter acinonychis]
MDQNTFDAIVGICQEKIGEGILWNSYESVGYFITTQWDKSQKEINFSTLYHILFSFIRKLTEGFGGNLVCLEHSYWGSHWMQNLLGILQQHSVDLDSIQQALINEHIQKIMKLPNDTQILISYILICDLFPITKNNGDVNQKVKKFLLDIWEGNQNRKTIQEDEAYLLLTSNMHGICILNSEQYQEILLELKNKYMNRETTTYQRFNDEQLSHEQLLEQAMQDDALDRMLALLKWCENNFKKEYLIL